MNAHTHQEQTKAEGRRVPMVFASTLVANQWAADTQLGRAPSLGPRTLDKAGQCALLVAIRWHLLALTHGAAQSTLDALDDEITDARIHLASIS